MPFPKSPCKYMVYTWGSSSSYMGTPLSLKYILHNYVEPLGLWQLAPFRCGGSSTNTATSPL